MAASASAASAADLDVFAVVSRSAGQRWPDRDGQGSDVMAVRRWQPGRKAHTHGTPSPSLPLILRPLPRILGYTAYIALLL
jgi:hypothetical protein